MIEDTKGTALILEGGGMRGVFTAGVLDAFLKRGIFFDYVAGTSAGASNGLSYASRQFGRAKFCNIDVLKLHNYIGLKYLFTQRCVMDFNYLFGDLPMRVCSFDFSAYLKSGRFILTATDCRTGKPAYFDTPKTPKALLAACRASCSMPVVCPMVEIDSRKYLDGGIVDPVPYARALKDGCKKLVIVLTRPRGYRKKPQWQYLGKLFFNYPALREALIKKSAVYNAQMDEIDAMEDSGRAVVIRPKMMFASRLTSDPKLLFSFYSHGIKRAVKTCEGA